MKKVAVLLLALAAIAVSFRPAAAADEYDAYLGLLTSDVSTICTGLSEQWARHFGFYSDACVCLPAATLPGFPHLEPGGSAGALATTLDLGFLDNLVNIDTTGIESLPSYLPLPLLLAHARLGIYPGFSFAGTKAMSVDLGFKYGGIPDITMDEFSLKNTVWGTDVRIGLLRGEGFWPDLTMSIGYDSVKGNMELSTEITDETKYKYNEVEYTGKTTTTLSLDTDWDIYSIGGTFLLGKNLLFMTPWIGVGIRTNSGTATTGVKSTTELEIADVTKSKTWSVEEKARAQDLIKWQTRYIAGLEFNIFFLRFGFQAEYDGSDIAGSLGLRFEI